MEISLVAPVDILAASIWTFSNSFFSLCEQLSQITSAFSNTGHIKAIKMVSRGFLSSFNFSFSIIFILQHAFSFKYSMC